MEIVLTIAFIVTSLIIILKCRGKTALLFTVIYLLAVIYLTFISREPMPYTKYSINPFRAAQRGLEFGGGVLSGIIHGDVKVTSWQSLKGIALNVLLFVPFGYLVLSLFPKLKSWRVIILGFCGSLLIEVLQLITRLGYADVDDLINNTIGAAIGVILYNLILKT